MNVGEGTDQIDPEEAELDREGAWLGLSAETVGL